MPRTEDPNPVRVYELVVTWPGRAIEILTLKARTVSTEGGVLTLRGTDTHLYKHVISFGPGYWIKYTLKED